MWGSFKRSKTSWEVHQKVCDGLGNPPKDLERVGSPSQRSGMGRRTLPEVWNGSGYPPRGPGLVEGPSGKFGTG